MSTQILGEKLRSLREANKLPLRKVAALMDIDVAILSKMERGERRLNRELVQKLAKLYKYNADELTVLFLSENLLHEIVNEKLGLKALQVAEAQLEYKAFLKTDRNMLVRKLQKVICQFEGIEKAWIYGSFSRKDDGPQSDIDVAVATDKKFSYFDLADVQYHAENALGKKVDIGFIESFKPHIWEQVKPDLKLIYEKG